MKREQKEENAKYIWKCAEKPVTYIVREQLHIF